MPPIDDAEVENRTTYHPPKTDARVAAHTLIRETLAQAMKDVIRVTPIGREQSLAITKLEEAMFWANAAIARQPDE